MMTDQELASLEEATELKAYAKLDFVPVRGEGCYLYTADGRPWLDMYGGHAVCITGHCHPKVVAAIREQAGKLLFYSNTVRSEVRARASEMLLRHAPHAGSKVFYCNSGAEANETSMKLARKFTGRTKIVSCVGSFHGRTIATLSACGIEHYKDGIAPLLDGHVHVPMGDAGALERALDADVAAVLLEPIQSIGGVTMAAPEYYRAAAALAEKNGSLLLFDEVQTGLGRTGTFFFGEHFGVKPDIISLAKGIASGVPCGVVIVAPRIAETVKVGDQGSTFGGGPLAMAAMLATLEVIEEEKLVERARDMGGELAGLAEIPGVKAVRGLGLLIGLELDRPAADVQRKLLEPPFRTVTGTAGPNVLRLLPPLVIDYPEIEDFFNDLEAVMTGTGPP